MSDFAGHVNGWSYDAQKIAASCARMEADGHVVGFAAGTPDLQWNWKRLQARGVNGVFAQDAEMAVLGHWRPNNVQRRGSCVEQGSSRAIEDSHIAALNRGEIVGHYCELAGEPMYGYCRYTFGFGPSHNWSCTCGRCPDGLMGSNYAESVAKIGMLERRVYGNIDLSKPREDLAIMYGNSVVPPELIEASRSHPIIAHRCQTTEELADAISAEYYGALCLPYIFDGSARDGEYCLPSGAGGHCTECCAVFLDENGDTAFGIQQSWQETATRYPKTLTQWAGEPKPLRPASYPVRNATLKRFEGQWEAWVFKVPASSSFRAVAT